MSKLTKKEKKLFWIALVWIKVRNSTNYLSEASANEMEVEVATLLPYNFGVYYPILLIYLENILTMNL